MVAACNPTSCQIGRFKLCLKIYTSEKNVGSGKDYGLSRKHPKKLNGLSIPYLV